MILNKLRILLYIQCITLVFKTYPAYSKESKWALIPENFKKELIGLSNFQRTDGEVLFGSSDVIGEIKDSSMNRNVLQITFQTTNTNCNSSISDGSVNITVIGGTEPYTYSWSEGSTDQNISNLSAGWYIVTVTDSSVPAITETDSVEVYSDLMPDVNLGNDTTICAGSNIILNAGNTDCTYLWSTGESTQTINVNSGGTYVASVTNSCGTVTDAIYVGFVFPLSYHNIGNDTTICSANPLSVNAGNQAAGYLWSTGETSHSISVNATGTYSVIISNACGSVYDTINVVAQPPLTPVNLGNDTTICVRIPRDLDAGNPGAQYLWSTGETTQIVSVGLATTYSVTVTNSCDTVTDEINVFVDYPIPTVYLPEDTVILCSGEELLLNSGNPGANHLWSTGETTTQISVNSAGTYYYTVSNACTSYSDTLVFQTIDPLPPVDFGNDTTICSSVSLVLDAGFSGADYLWSTGEITQSVVVNSAGTYSLVASNLCGSVGDTIAISAEQPLVPVDLGSDTRVCEGTPLFLNAGNNGATYLWSTGETAQIIAVSTNGIYSVVATNVCGSSSDTIELRVDPVLLTVNLGDDRIICDDSSVVLDAGTQVADYLWSTGETTQTITVNESGVYAVYLTNSCGTVSDAITVIYEDPLPEISLGPDTLICQGAYVLLDPGYLPGMYVWSTSDTTQTINVNNPQAYSVTISNACGSVTDEIYIFHRDSIRVGANATCVGDDMFVHCVNDGLYSYSWIIPGGDTVPGQTIIIENVTEANNGHYQFVLVDTVLCGCGGFDYEVNVPPVLGVSHFDETCIAARDGIAEFIFPEKTPIQEFDPFFKYHLYFDTIWYSTASEEIIFGSLYPRTYNYVFTLDSVCYIRDSIKIEHADFICTDHTLYIPDAFTPNGDGINDTLFVFGSNIYYFNMVIYDRWTEKMFEFQDISRGWDGTYGGLPCKQDTYVYVLQVFFTDGCHETRKGRINLLR